MAVSPPLHRWLHHDADEPDHQCAVTAFNSGQIDAFVPAHITFLLPAAGHVTIGTFVGSERSSSCSSVLEHAPPAGVSSLIRHPSPTTIIFATRTADDRIIACLRLFRIRFVRWFSFNLLDFSVSFLSILFEGAPFHVHRNIDCGICGRICSLRM